MRSPRASGRCVTHGPAVRRSRWIRAHTGQGRSVLLAAAASLVCCGGASAAVPGRNGALIFEAIGRQGNQLHSILPDGSRLLRESATGTNFAVSPDGRWLAHENDFAGTQ